jgi:hypothetical protein
MKRGNESRREEPRAVKIKMASPLTSTRCP